MSYLLLLSLVLLFGQGVGSVKRMYKNIEDVGKLTEENGKLLNNLFKYAFSGYRCVEIIPPHTSFGKSALEHLYRSFEMPPFVIGNSDEGDLCSGFIIFAESARTIVRLVQFYPLQADYRYVFILSPERLDSILEYNDQADYFFGDSDILVASSRNLSVAYRFSQPERDQFEFIDDFTQPWKVQDIWLDFRGRSIRALTYNCSLFSQIGPLRRKSANYIEGAEANIFIHIARSLNLTVEWQVLDNMPVHNMIFPRYKWYDQRLLRQKSPYSADVAFCGLTLTHKMMKSEIENSKPLISLCFRFLVPRPKPIQTEWNSIFTVFTIELWIIIGVALLITSVSLQRVSASTRKYVHTEGIYRYTKLGGSTLQLYSILVQTDIPSSVELQGASRYVLASWSIATMIITTLFTSELVSLMTTQQYTNKIDTVEELLKNNFRWGYISQPDLGEFFSRENENNARLKMRATLMIDLKDHSKYLQAGDHFLWGAQILDGFFIPEEDIPLYILDNFEVADDCFQNYYINFAFRPGSPYTPAFNTLLMAYQEAGLLEREFRRIMRWYERRYPYSSKVLQLTKPEPSDGCLELQHLTGVIQICVLGIGVAIVVFILEMLQKCYI